MDWLLATPQIQSVFASLGSFVGDKYVVGPNALAVLNEIYHKLTYEDQTLRTFRRSISFCQNVRTDLIPLLVNAKDEHVLESVIRILVNLTVPVECLFSVDVMYRTDMGRHTIFDLNKLLYTSKEAFTDPKSTKSVVEFMKHVLESDTKMSQPKCEQINNCLLLLRNVLHIPETNANFIVPEASTRASATHKNVTMQNSILWNLFIQSIDKLLLYLMTIPERQLWGVTIVQLIALMYKDQDVGTLQKLLNLWFEASLSDSSDDNESNTSPPKQISGNSSPMLTSDPTSDSSDNGKADCQSKESYKERRQALWNETEVTLQEVSRKGYAYKNSMFTEHARYYEEHPNLVQKPDSVAVAVTQVILTEESEAMDAVEDDSSDFSNQVSEEIHELNNDKQSAEPNTICIKDTKMDDMNFKLPSGLPIKVKCDVNSVQTDIKFSQKIPNSSQPVSNGNGLCYPQKRECPSSQSELSDCGYGTQVENPQFISTSSNDDDGPQEKPQHRKPPCNSKPRNKQRIDILDLMDQKELRRKKLVKRSKSSLINMKGLVQHTPTDDDISYLLKEFTVDFLLKGYGNLVQELHSQLLTDIKIPIDTSHLFWLITYFLKFAVQLELDMEHINTILTFDVISYLTYEGVSLCEQLELNSRQEGSDLKPYLRRMHLVVTAIREFLQAIESFKKIAQFSESDQEYLQNLQIKISATEDLRCLFVLLLRRFNPGLHTKQYLQDLIVTNHILLNILDSISNSSNNNKINMLKHISQFGTLDIMHYYGMLLEDFNNNGEYLNNCIFTMMHHIGGDLELAGTLFQPVILKTFSRILEIEYELCDDWSDLIEYVIHKFINTPEINQLNLPKTSLTELTKEHNLENAICSWGQEDMDTLHWYYLQSKKNSDVVAKIVKLFNNNDNKWKSRISIVQQLLQQDIITLVEYDDLMKFEDVEYQRAFFKTSPTPLNDTRDEIKESKKNQKPSNDIEMLKDLIIKDKKEKHLVWLQKLLLECCYIKITLNKDNKRDHKTNCFYVMEPMAYHCILKNKSIPIVQWNNEQVSCMQYQPFLLLLHKLGFQLPVDAGSVYARLPEFWTAGTMYGIAKKLGSLDKLIIKFDINDLELMTETQIAQIESYPSVNIPRKAITSRSYYDMEVDSNDDSCVSVIGRTLPPVQEVDEPSSQVMFAIPTKKQPNSIIRFKPMPIPLNSVPNWLQLVMRSKCITNTEIGNGQHNSDVVPPLLSDAESIQTTSAPITLSITSTTTTVYTNTITASLASANTPLLCQSITNLIATSSSAINNVNENNNSLNNNHNKINKNNKNNNKNCSKHHVKQQPPQQQQQDQKPDKANVNEAYNSGDDEGMLPSELTSSIGIVEREYGAMVASAYEHEIAYSDRASVASDRMYVSDEDEKQDCRLSILH